MRGAIAIRIRDRISLSISILISKQEITDIPLPIDTCLVPQGEFCSEVNVNINAATCGRMIDVIGNLYYQ